MCHVGVKLFAKFRLELIVAFSMTDIWNVTSFSNVVQKDAVPLHYKNHSGCPIPSGNSVFTTCFTCALLTMTIQT